MFERGKGTGTVYQVSYSAWSSRLYRHRVYYEHFGLSLEQLPQPCYCYFQCPNPNLQRSSIAPVLGARKSEGQNRCRIKSGNCRSLRGKQSQEVKGLRGKSFERLGKCGVRYFECLVISRLADRQVRMKIR